MSAPWIVQDRTRDATRSSFAGAGRWQEDNANDDHGRPGRLDYAVTMDDAAPAIVARAALAATAQAEKIVERTRDRTRSVFAGVAAFAEDNANDDHGSAGRRDYSVEMTGGGVVRPELFLSAEQGYTAFCAAGLQGDAVTATIPAAKWAAPSQEGADALALADAQAQAEAALVCVAIPDWEFAALTYGTPTTESFDALSASWENDSGSAA